MELLDWPGLLVVVWAVAVVLAAYAVVIAGAAIWPRGWSRLGRLKKHAQVNIPQRERPLGNTKGGSECSPPDLPADAALDREANHETDVGLLQR